MDDLEFRRRIYANPADSDETLLQAAKDNKELDEFWQDVKRQDEKLSRAINIPVPDDLANKLIWQQSVREFAHTKRKQRWYIGLAAGITLTIGLGVTAWQQQHIALSEAALAHMYYAEHETPVGDVPVTTQIANAKLALFGAELDPSVGKIASVNYCHLDTIRSLHMIIETAQGKMSVFLVPEKNRSIQQRFTDSVYEGLSYAQHKTNVLVVAEKGTDLPAFQSLLKQRLKFSA